MKGSRTNGSGAAEAGTAEAGTIELRGVWRTYAATDARSDGETLTDALRGVDLTVARGELVAIVGPSGSGKSTLLHLMGALDTPTEGTVTIAGNAISGLDRGALADLRNRTVGFVFQAYNLLNGLSAADNVALPALLARRRPERYRERVAELLELVGLADKAQRRPPQLSGGEQQRLAVARALLMDPPIVLADEPTGNLDSSAGADVVALLHACHAAGRTVVIVTHDLRVASQAGRIVHLRDGVVVDETQQPAGDRPLDALLQVGE